MQWLGMDRIFLDLLVMAATYLAGACIYVLRIPERFKPGAFDIFLNSHQLWHCFVAGRCGVGTPAFV
jgi:predicted membrane channel-forming protein YqfA (hemolysin III family)